MRFRITAVMLPKVMPLWKMMFAQAGKLWKKFGAVRVIILTPTLTATIIRLYVPSNLTLLKARIPLAMTMPNMATPAPPKTELGMEATTAAIFGNKPRAMRMIPDAATTKRLLTRVTAIRPTFCAKAV